MKRAAAYQNKNRSESAERRGGAKPTLNSGPGPGDAAGEAMRRAAAYKSGKAKPSGNHPGGAVSEGAGAAAKEAMRRAAEYKKNAGAAKPAAEKPAAGAAAAAAKEAMKRAAAYKAERDGK